MTEVARSDRRAVRLCLVTLGAQGLSHVTTQLILLREMLAVFSGNELVIGVLLGCWLLPMGLGAGLGRWTKTPERPYFWLVMATLGVATLPVVTVSAGRLLRNVVFVRGTEISFLDTLTSALVLLGPYGLLAGFCVSLAAAALGRARQDSSQVGTAYLADGAGDVLGGALFAVVLGRLGNHYITLVGVAVLVAISAAALAWVARHRGLALGALSTATVVGTLGLSIPLDRVTLQVLHPGREILSHTSSLYSDWIVSKSAGQIDWIENGVAVASSEDTERVEEAVHFAMAQRPRPERVLVLGGAVSGVPEEVLRYPVRRVDCVEMDPALLLLRERFAEPHSDSRLRFIERDGRAYVRQAHERYDVLIVDLPDPTTAQLNRYYTREFFAEAQRILRPGGVVSLTIGQYVNYVSPELEQLLAITRRTLSTAFRQILVIPTAEVNVLASNQPLTLDIASRLRAQGVSTRWVTESMLEATVSPERVRALGQAALAPAPLNEDFSPTLEAAALRRWLGRFSLPPTMLLAGIAALVVGLIATQGRVPTVVAATGFASASLEVLLLLGLQLAFGAVYGTAALVVTSYMLGSTLGAWRFTRQAPRQPRRVLGLVMAGLGILAFACPVALKALAGLSPGNPLAVSSFVGLGALLGMLAGAAFPLAAKVDFRGVAPTLARLYSADLLGAALGAWLVGTLLVPSLGVAATSSVVGLLCVVGVLLVLMRRPLRWRKA